MKAYRLYLVICLLAPAAASVASGTGCPQYREFAASALSEPGQQVAGQLTTALDTAEAEMLARYLDRAADSGRSSDYVLRNYARVALAAAHLNRQSYDQARQALAQVELDSPAAVRAALLLAESYRLQGQHSVAAQWMLRIADRYSSNPDALSGLLLAADDAAQRGDIANALAVYSRVLDKSLGNIDEIRALRGQPEGLYQVVISGRIDNTRAVSSEVIQRALSHAGTDSLLHYARLKRIAGEMACLAQREESLRETSFTASLDSAKDNAFTTMLESEKRLTQSDIEQLQASLAQADPYDDTDAMQRRLDEAREALATIERRLNDIQQSAPAESTQRKDLKAVQARRALLAARQAESQAAINQHLSKVLDELLADYREMAGEAQLGRAQMKQLFSRVGAN